MRVPSSRPLNLPEQLHDLVLLPRREDLRIETRYDNEMADYVIVTHRPDGRVHTERFSIESQFRSRVIEVQKYIDDEGWRSTGSPVIMQDGWRNA
jgi:hypothetical protein